MAGSAQRLDTMQSVELAEGMEIHLRAAGPLLRFLAYFLDLIIELVAITLVGLIIAIISPVTGGNVGEAFYYLTFFLIWYFYHVIFEVGRKGATLGKRAFGLRVVNESGGTVTIGQSMIRNFIRGFEMLLPFLPLVAFFHPRFQRLGDLAAGTQVIYSNPRIDQINTGPPPLESVPVNLTLSREEEAAIVSFRYRASGWSEARQMELGNHLQPLTRELGKKAVAKIHGMAHWLEGGR